MTTLDPHDVAKWTEQPFEVLFSLSRNLVEDAQWEALCHRFEAMRSEVEALDRLATNQGLDRIDEIDDIVPVLFDHRVYKSYPITLIEKRQFPRLTSWLDRLTTHDLTSVPLDGLTSLDDWMTRLDEHGMIVGHSTGTSGKLSFLPRSRTEWPAWKNTYFETMRAATGVDLRVEEVPIFSATYRTSHHMATKMGALFGAETALGEERRYTLYDYPLSSDLLSLAGRLRQAEERGELEELELDPVLLEQRAQLIEASRHRDEDLEQWFAKLAEAYRGQRVSVGAPTPDLVRLAMKGRESGLVCDFAPGSFMMIGGGMKTFKDAPADWEQLLKDFFGIDRVGTWYGMSEIMGQAPRCSAGYYHFLPYTIPIVLDEDAAPLPREGLQTGRMALFDLIAETYWGGFISGDRVRMYWDDACTCGWRGPRVEDSIARFSELGGGDDKITCAGTAKAYNDFMDYVGVI